MEYSLEFRFSEVIHGEIVRDAERIETNVISDVTLQVLRVGKEWNSWALFDVKSGRCPGG